MLTIFPDFSRIFFDFFPGDQSENSVKFHQPMKKSLIKFLDWLNLESLKWFFFVQPILLIGGKWRKKLSTGGAGVGTQKVLFSSAPSFHFHLSALRLFLPLSRFTPTGQGTRRCASPSRTSQTQCVAPLVGWKRSTFTAIRSALNGRPGGHWFLGGDFYRRKSGENILNGGKIPINSLKDLQRSSIMQIIFTNFSEFFKEFFGIIWHFLMENWF